MPKNVRSRELQDERLLSIEDLCQRWSVSERYLRDLRDKRVFPGIKLFGRKHVRYKLSDVLAVERGEWILPKDQERSR